MSYVDSNLMTGEDVVYKGQIHWFVFIPGILITAFSIYLFGIDPTGPNLERPVLAVSGSQNFAFAAFLRSALPSIAAVEVLEF